MTIFGIDEADSLVASLAAFDSEAEANELFARAAWSGIAEPGDRVALAAIRQLSAANALRALIGKRGAQWWATALEPQLVSPDDASKALARWQPRASASAVVQSLRQAERCGARLVVPGSVHWPSALDDLGDHSPIAIWVRGTAAALDSTRRSVALVGARAASGYGEHITMEASAGLVDRGFAIVSGAAYGIDGMAHRAALASKGQTIAFLAGGVDRFYPSGHDTLLTQIAAEGAVVAELPCGSSPTKWRFLQRNRLIAAVSQATVVLEAGSRSGSLNTAHHASTLGRPLGAVPGPVTSAASQGCHKLIRELNAVCVTGPDEMAELAGDAQIAESLASSQPDHEVLRLLDAMSERAPRDCADIARRSGLSISAVQALLGELELAGLVREGDDGWTKRPKKTTS